jgi:hypothetical protein
VSDPPDAVDLPPVPAPLAADAARLKRRREAKAKRRRRRRLILIAAPVVGVLLWASVSYSAYMLEPTSMSWSQRSAEWVRQKVPFGNWIVDNAEHVYYSANAPKKGGKAPKRLPAVGLSVARSKHILVWPPPIKPVFAHPLPGEGVWKPAGPPLDGGPPVLVTTFRPEVEYPELLAYVAWFDQTRTATAYYPGRYEPPNAAVRGPMMVPYSQRWRLLATFNGGFTYEDGENGSTVNGRVNEPLKDGGAVRAMEFDINADWHTLITYTHDHGFVPKMVEPQPNQSPERYLEADDRDFFAVYQRLPGPVAVPLR